MTANELHKHAVLELKYNIQSVRLVLESEDRRGNLMAALDYVDEIVKKDAIFVRDQVIFRQHLCAMLLLKAFVKAACPIKYDAKAFKEKVLEQLDKLEQGLDSLPSSEDI